VLGIRDILVRIRGSVSDPTRDPTPFFSDFKDTKIIFFLSYFFLITYSTTRHIIFSLKIEFYNFLLNIFVRIRIRISD
jgi:hypothetical protein